MQNWNINHTVDLNKPLWAGLKNIFSSPAITKLDANAHTWNVSVFRDAEPVSLTGYTAVGYFVRPDGADVPPVQGTVSGNTASVVFPAQCYVQEGTLKGVMKISNTSTGEVITLDVLTAKVGESTTGKVVAEEEEVIDVAARILALETSVRQLRYSVAVAMTVAFGMVGVDRSEMNNSTKDDNIKLTFTNNELGLSHDTTADTAIFKFLDLIDDILNSFS